VEPPRASEEQLISLVRELPDGRVGCTTVGRAQLAVAVARGRPGRTVDCTLFDLHLLQRARAAIGIPPENLSLEARADLPDAAFDAVVLPLRAGGDTELAWELLQQGFLRLVEGGVFLTAVDAPRDRWVAGRMQALFGRKVARIAGDEAVAYRATKHGALKKVKTFTSEFAFRDRDRLIRAISRPGVFSHRRLDLGARTLIESLAEPVGGALREFLAPGARVLDLGCGSGVVGFAAALRAPGASVHAVDSMPRAIECALRGAALNGLSGYSGEASADGGTQQDGSFDLVLANPPYFSQQRIAGFFADVATRALRRGGRLHAVTKKPEFLLERLPRDFQAVRPRRLRDYVVVDGVRR